MEQREGRTVHARNLWKGVARAEPAMTPLLNRAASLSAEEKAALDVSGPAPCEHAYADVGTVCPDCVAPKAPPAMAARMRIPEHLANARIDTWLPANGAPRQECADYVLHWPPSPPMLWLGGNIGTGKSHLAAGILRALGAGQFWTATEIVDLLREASSSEYSGPWPQAVLINTLVAVPVLVIDDLGAEVRTEFSDRKMAGIVDTRYRGQMPTVVTTNADPNVIDPRMRSRLMSGRIVRFTGADRRLV